MESKIKPKLGAIYKDGMGNLKQITDIIKESFWYPIVSGKDNYTLDGRFYDTSKSILDLDLTKEYDKDGNLLLDHNKNNIDISNIPTVEEQKKFTEELNEKMNNPYLRQEGGSHYKDMVIQPIEYILKNNIGYAEGNIIKYVSRWKNKNGIKDLKKALHVLQILIYEEENKIKE